MTSHKESTTSGPPYDELYLENFTQSNSNIKTSEILTNLYHSADATDMNDTNDRISDSVEEEARRSGASFPHLFSGEGAVAKSVPT